jgi:hypothetical protein
MGTHTRQTAPIFVMMLCPCTAKIAKVVHKSAHKATSLTHRHRERQRK